MPFNKRKQTAKAILSKKKIQDPVQMISLWPWESSFNRQYTIWSHMCQPCWDELTTVQGFPWLRGSHSGLMSIANKNRLCLFYTADLYPKATTGFCTNFLPSMQALSQGHGRQKWILEQGVQQNILFLIKGIFRCKFNPWSNMPCNCVRLPLER